MERMSCPQYRDGREVRATHGDVVGPLPDFGRDRFWVRLESNYMFRFFNSGKFEFIIFMIYVLGTCTTEHNFLSCYGR